MVAMTAGDRPSKGPPDAAVAEVCSPGSWLWTGALFWQKIP